MSGKIIFVRKTTGLVKELGFTDVIVWIFTAVAAAINMSVSFAWTYNGSYLPFVYLLNGLLLLPIAVLVGAMVGSFPRCGGMYVLESRIVHPTFAFFVEWTKFSEGVGIGILASLNAIFAAGAFVQIGLVYNMPDLVNLGSFLYTLPGTFTVAMIGIFVAWVVSTYGIKITRHLMRTFYAIAVAGNLVSMGYLFFLGGTVAAPKAWDAMFGQGTYNKIIDLALANGWNEAPWSWGVTLSAFLVSMIAYATWENVTYLGGEVKSPTRNLMRGIALGFLLVIAYYFVFSFSAYYAFGASFISQYSFLYSNHPDLLATVMTPIAPTIPFYAGILTGNVWLSSWFSLAVILWCTNCMLGYVGAKSRALFAFSFDRAIPEVFARVSRRGSPTWSVALLTVMGLVGALIFMTGMSSAFGYVSMITMFPFWALGIAAMVFPYVKRNLFEMSRVNWRIRGLPVITILGLYSFLVSFYLVLVMATQVPFEASLVLVLLIAVGWILYIYKQARNVTEGIDVTKIYGEFPPE